ncbi:hypothetical protein KLP40_19445 [Hymenobacter sp. NST-14]|uniref:hypothetical protein n=1 Tax=Hymenobacter piscis TaxID=2839984 RepID=UPI001C036156|nr:hypothetical protein [Hymenobacter piscis]MBT9395351.1 hypothetical protein [Hymenobacter piscis]
MSIPTFIQIGESAETIFNTSHITAIKRESFPITDRNKESYAAFPHTVEAGVAHSILVNVVGGRGGMEYIYSSEAKRNAKFEEIRTYLHSITIANAPWSEPDTESKS